MPRGRRNAVAEAFQRGDEVLDLNGDPSGLVDEGPVKKLAQNIKKGKTVVKIPSLQVKIATITIKGTTGLLVNRFDEKSRKEIEDTYRKVAKNKKIPLTPEEEYQRSLYRLPGKTNVFGVPAAGLKKCAVSACRFVDGITMAQAYGAFHVIEDSGGLVIVKGKPRMDERMVRVGTFGNKKPATRRRAIFDTWSITMRIKYRTDVLTPEQIVNLYQNAGFSVGLCEYRTEKGGDLGQFEVVEG